MAEDKITNDGTLDYTSDYQAGDFSANYGGVAPVTDGSYALDFSTYVAEVTQAVDYDGWGVSKEDAAAAYGRGEATGSPGVAPSLLATLVEGASKWFGDDKSGLMKWLDDDKTGQKGAAMITLAGKFAEGALGAKSNERKTVALEKDADAKMMVAQATQQKMDNIANGQISKTNFGAKPAGLLYSNRRKIDPMIRTGVA